MHKPFTLFLLLFIFLATPSLLFSQSINKQPVTIEIHGFVRADAAFDSRLNLEAREGFVTFYPLKPNIGPDGLDINAVPNFSQWGMTSRMNVAATGPDVLGAKVRAFVEGDFTGPSNLENNAFRLRHGYVEMKWTRVSLLAGQYWSPLDVPEMLPRVLALNTGAPFRSFTRSPLVKMEYCTGKLKLVAVSYTQRDYPSPGVHGSSPNYLRHALIPNLHFQIQYIGNRLFAGAGIDYKQLRPRLITDSLNKADELVRSLAVHLFAKFQSGGFQLKTQVVYGQNLSDHLMMGGYVVESADSLDHRTYLNVNHVTAWADLTYDLNRVRLGLYGGYSKNLGTKSEASGPFYGRGHDVASVYRFAPRIDLLFHPVQFTLEAEYTAVNYGIPDSRFIIRNTENISNIRLQTAVVYTF